VSADSATATQAADKREAGIGSTDWFDGSLFNTEVTEGYGEHGGRDDLAGVCIGFWPGQSLPRLSRGGKIKLVGDLTPRTIAAKHGGTEAFPPSQAAGPRIRGDRLRALAVISSFWPRSVIGRLGSGEDRLVYPGALQRLIADRRFHFRGSNVTGEPRRQLARLVALHEA
jgi:hypothetical protein